MWNMRNVLFVIILSLLLSLGALVSQVYAAERSDCGEIMALMSPVAPSENLYNDCSDIQGDIYNPGVDRLLELRDNAGNIYAYIDDQSRVRGQFDGKEYVDSISNVEDLRYREGVVAYTNYVEYHGYPIGVHRNANDGAIHGTMRWAWQKINSVRRAQDAVEEREQPESSIK